MNSFCFYVPGAYTLKIRMKSWNKRLGLFCYHIVPTYFLSCFIAGFPLWAYLVTIVAFYTLYEIGYIYNDAETIKKEVSPSLRLTDAELQYYERNKWTVYVFRLFFFSVLFFMELSILGTSVLLAFCLILAELVVFLIYNNVRGRKSLPVFFFLELGKYVPFAFLHQIQNKISLWAALFCIYAFPNTVERLAFKRYGFVWMQRLLPNEKALLLFRLLFSSCILIVCYTVEQMRTFLPLFIFLFCFRLLAWLNKNFKSIIKMISVCLASYNGGKYLKKQLNSILSQLGDDDEIVVSDDGSTDNTVDVVNSGGVE